MIVDLNHDEARYLRLKLLGAISDLTRAAARCCHPTTKRQLTFLQALLDKLTKEPR